MTDLTKPRAGAPLTGAARGNVLYRDWLDNEATVALASTVTKESGTGEWFGSDEARSWASEHRQDLPGEGRARFDHDLAALHRGDASVVVTGQQPGFLGGPLLTIHKIATAVALADRLSAAGKPTIPVFWSGDDDDDLVEALDLWAWRPPRGLVRSRDWLKTRVGDGPRRRLGTLGPEAWFDAEGDWFGGGAGADDDLELGRQWQRTLTAGDDWRTLVRRCLLAAFRGCGLMVVSGDDSRLHAAAGGFYAEVSARRTELAELVHAQGRRLEAEGGHAQISDRSLSRSLYVLDGDMRRPLGKETVPVDGSVRPGIMLRSLLQDRMLAPRAVVVGPGELAYLSQLEPLYRALGIVRSPLVPRLAAWLLPRSMDRELLDAHHRITSAGAGVDEAVASWLHDNSTSLEVLLQRELDLPADRARYLAGRRRSRWERGVRSLIRGEQARIRTAGPREPEWVFPAGRRQERGLAWIPVLALGGRRLRDLVLRAADAHLEAGACGDWREWECEIDEPHVF